MKRDLIGKRIFPLCAAGWLLLGLGTPAGAGEMCEVAREVAGKAARTFAANQAEGLKLFIKARDLCSDEPIYSYNLGAAYFQYGRMAEAADFMGQAVAKNGNRPEWRNNLALALLKNGDPAAALPQAEKAAAGRPDDPAIAETLAQARAADGDAVAALKGLRQFAEKSGKKPELVKRYEAIRDAALGRALSQAKEGQPESALRQLAALNFDPKAARARVLLLAKSGRGEEALNAAEEARRQFPGDTEITAVFGAAANQVALSLYQRFKSGDQKAVKAAKELAGRYPNAEPLQTAYNKLFDALTDDAAAIPEAVARAEKSAGGGRADDLLASLSIATSPAESTDLKVDVDQNIPAGRKAGQYDVAVVIGNQRYSREHGVPDVDYAGRDAAVMKEYLVRTMGYDARNIITTANATLGDFNQIFGSDSDARGKLFNFVKPNESRVFVYYAGHGAPDPKSSDAYFVPVEADPQYLSTSGYRLATFYDNLAKLPAKEVTVVLDACFSGNSGGGLLFKGVSSIVFKPRTDQKKPDNSVVMASARADQVSTWYPEKRHSLFTYYFLKGLRGEADGDKNRQVTVGEMAAFLDKEVPYMARRLKGAEQQPTVSGPADKVLAWLDK